MKQSFLIILIFFIITVYLIECRRHHSSSSHHHRNHNNHHHHHNNNHHGNKNSKLRNHRNNNHHHHHHGHHHSHNNNNNNSTKELDCSKNSEPEVDQVFGRISGYGNVSRTFPSNQQELNDYCKGQFSDIKIIESYANRCKRGLPKQYFSIMLFTVKGSMQRICKKNSKKAKQFLSASGCIRRASEPFDICHRNLIQRLHRIKFTDDKKKIPYTCCEYYTLKKCFENAGRNKAKCTDKEMETVDELIESTSSNALNFFCGEYADDSDKCEKLGPLPESPSTESGNKKQSSRPKFLRSISLTVAEIFDTFPEISTRN